MSADGAVKPVAGGVALDVDVTPGAGDEAFPSGWNPWRGRVEARVTAPPEKGAANAALTRTIAAFFRVDARDVTVAHGATSRRKTVIVRGLKPEDARKRLAEALTA